MNPLWRPVDHPDGSARADHPHDLVGGRPDGVVRTSPPRRTARRRSSLSANGIASASASTQSRAPLRVARRCCRPASNSSGVKSLAVTPAPATAAGNGRIARSRCDIQHPLPGTDAARLHQPRSEFGNQVRGHSRIVARRPQRAVLGLELTVGGRCDRAGHLWFLRWSRRESRLWAACGAHHGDRGVGTASVRVKSPAQKACPGRTGRPAGAHRPGVRPVEAA